MNLPPTFLCKCLSLSHESVEIWINRRESGNADIPNLGSLTRPTALSHAREKKVYPTMNQSGYTQDFYAEILAFVKEIERNCKVDDFIVGDLGLICILIEKELDIAIHISSLAGVLTNSAALFFKRLGVQRIVFAVILRRRPSSILLTGRGRVWNMKYLFLDLAV